MNPHTMTPKGPSGAKASQPVTLTDVIVLIVAVGLSVILYPAGMLIAAVGSGLALKNRRYVVAFLYLAVLLLAILFVVFHVGLYSVSHAPQHH